MMGLPNDIVEQREVSNEASPEASGVKNLGLLAHLRFLLFTFFVGSTLLEYGFDQGEIGGFQAMVGFLEVFGYKDPRVPGGWNIATGPQTLISSFMLMGAFIASMLAGPIGSYLGRRHSIMVALVVLVVGITVQVVTTSIRALYFARVITGFSNGMLMAFTMVYVAELAPAHFRGLAYGFLTSWVSLGTALGNIINNATEGIHGRLAYQIPLFTLYGMPVIIFIALPFLPESPRWLLLRGKNEQALKSLTWMRNGAFDRLALLQEYEEMKINAEHELENQSYLLFFDLFNKKNRRRTAISIGVGIINAAVGGMFLLAFGTYLYTVVGVMDPFKWIILSQFMGLFGQVISYVLVIYIGRRTMLLIGVGMCTIFNLALGAIYVVPSYHGTQTLAWGTVAVATLYLFAFGFGVVPYTYLVAAEIPAQNLRAYTSGLSTGIGFVFAWLTTFTAPYFINPAQLAWEGKYGWVWFGSSVLTFFFVWFAVPEVRGRSLEEIEEMFDKGVPSRDFQTYVCESTSVARGWAEKDLNGEGEAVHVEVSEKA